ncbi:hypothetical protein [Agathobacter sp.]
MYDCLELLFVAWLWHLSTQAFYWHCGHVLDYYGTLATNGTRRLTGASVYDWF